MTVINSGLNEFLQNQARQPKVKLTPVHRSRTSLLTRFDGRQPINGQFPQNESQFGALNRVPINVLAFRCIPERHLSVVLCCCR